MSPGLYTTKNNGKREQWENATMIKINNDDYTDFMEYTLDSVLRSLTEGISRKASTLMVRRDIDRARDVRANGFCWKDGLLKVSPDQILCELSILSAN